MGTFFAMINSSSISWRPRLKKVDLLSATGVPPQLGAEAVGDGPQLPWDRFLETTPATRPHLCPPPSLYKLSQSHI